MSPRQILYRCIILLIAINLACTPQPPIGEPVAQPTESQTPTGLAVLEFTATSKVYDPSQPGLIVEESIANVVGNGNTITELLQDQAINVQVDDHIELGQEGHSILKFPDVLDVELFRNTNIFLTGLKQDSDGSTAVTLSLNQGHLFVRPKDKSFAQVVVETTYATITTLEDGAEFDVCHNEALTCVLVTKGTVEVLAHGRKEILKAGEASYVLKDQSPVSAICAPVEMFVDWEKNYRLSADTPTLSTMLSELPQEPCDTQNLGLPADAHILYQDEFKKPSSGWSQGKIDNYLIGYTGGEYYQIQILDSNFKFLAYLPNKLKYEDVNIDLKVLTKTAQEGDFHYGLVFRRSGDQYYAFTISPRNKHWYVLKSSSDALKILKEGANDGIQGFESEDTLRVSTRGSTFFFRINGVLVYQISDPDYAIGEVGLFVQTRDSSDALIAFDSITIWDMEAPFIEPTPYPTPIRKEICSNKKDDDRDGLIDRAYPDCKGLGLPTLVPFITDTPGTIDCSEAPEQPADCGTPYDFEKCECGSGQFGCTDPDAENYDPFATDDDGSCTYAAPDVYGCTDPAAENYDPSATIDDGSCTYPPYP